MAKKREDREGRKKKTDAITSDMDDGFVSPALSLRNVTLENIKPLLLHSRYAQILVSLTFVGLVLRLYNLGFNSLWLDEASTYTFASMSIPGIWQATTAGEFNPPLFYWIEHLMLLIWEQRSNPENRSGTLGRTDHSPGVLYREGVR